MLTKTLILLSMFACLTSSLFAQTITGVSISFKTTSNDKDGDTGVEAIYKMADNTIVAYKRDNYGHFDNNSEYLATLDLKNSTIGCGNTAGSTITINIFSNGHDTWNFDFDILIACSDGSTKSYSFRGISLNQNNNNFVGTLTN